MAVKGRVYSLDDLPPPVDNDAPVVTTSAGATAYVEGANSQVEVAIDPAIGLTDPDNAGPGAIVSARIQITANYQYGADLLSLPGSFPGTATFDALTGTLTITATGQSLTTEQWRQMIGNVRYSNSSDTPSTEPRTVTITAYDGTDWSAPATKVIAVTATDDAPALDLDPAAPGIDASSHYGERQGPVPVMLTANVLVDDSAGFGGGTLRIARFANNSVNDVLAIENQGNGSVQIGVAGNVVSYGGVAIGTFTGGGADDLVISLNAAADQMAVIRLLRAITYTNPSANPISPGPSYAVTLSDANGLTSPQALLNVVINQLPDPTLFDFNGPADGTEAHATYQRGAPPVPIAPDAVLTDPDTGDFSGRTLTVAFVSSAGGDTLSILTGGPIGLAGNNVTYNGNVIGQLGSASASSIAVELTAQTVSLAALQALVRAFGFSNMSSDLVSQSRTIGFQLSGDPASGGITELTTLDSNGSPTAVADTASVASNATVNIAVLANDTDPDGGPKFVATIAGSAANVGVPITLPSGARVTLNADGSLTYDPNGALGVGASDGFSYALNGGSTASVSLGITAGSVNGVLLGTQWADVVAGSAAAESFDLSQGGADQVSGGGGNDGIYFGSAFGPGDSADGGGGIDTFAVQGNYSGLTLNGVANVEVLLLASGADTRFGDNAGNFYDYSVTTVDGNVPANSQLTVIASELRAGEDLAFNGAAETDGRFRIFAGRGTDNLTGGAGSDGFFFGADGNLTGADRINGGGGTDSIALRGNYVGLSAIVFQNASFTGIEVLTFLSGHTNEFGGVIDTNGFDYDVTLADGNIAAGQRLDVIASNLRANESARVDARAELDGSVRILAGAGNDTLFGSAGNDTLYGGLGADALDGSGGSDTYVYRALAESTAASRDTIAFVSGDKIDLSLIDASTAAAGNEAFAFIGTAAFSNVAGQLRASQSGGQWIVEGDVNGDGIADLAIAVTSAAPLIAADFVL